MGGKQRDLSRQSSHNPETFPGTESKTQLTHQTTHLTSGYEWKVRTRLCSTRKVYRINGSLSVLPVLIYTMQVYGSPDLSFKVTVRDSSYCPYIPDYVACCARALAHSTKLLAFVSVLHRVSSTRCLFSIIVRCLSVFVGTNACT